MEAKKIVEFEIESEEARQDALSRAVEFIRSDAQDRPESYLEDSVVPEGGE